MKINTKYLKGNMQRALHFPSKGGMRLFLHFKGDYSPSQMTFIKSYPHTRGTFQILSCRLTHVGGYVLCIIIFILQMQLRNWQRSYSRWVLNCSCPHPCAHTFYYLDSRQVGPGAREARRENCVRQPLQRPAKDKWREDLPSTGDSQGELNGSSWRTRSL